MKSLWLFTLDFCLRLSVGFALLQLCIQTIFSPCVTSSPQPCWRNKAPHSVVKWWSAESIKTKLLFLYRGYQDCWQRHAPTVEVWTSRLSAVFDGICVHGQGLEWSWGNQIWSLLKEKVNHCGKPPSHCLSPFRGSGFIFSLLAARSLQQDSEDINLLLTTQLMYQLQRHALRSWEDFMQSAVSLCKLEHFEE